MAAIQVGLLSAQIRRSFDQLCLGLQDARAAFLVALAQDACTGHCPLE